MPSVGRARLAARFLAHRFRELHPFEVQALLHNACDLRCAHCRCPVAGRGESRSAGAGLASARKGGAMNRCGYGYGSGRLAAAGLLLAVVALVAAACGGDEKTIETEQGDVTLSREGQGVHIEDKAGRFEGHFGEGAELPEGFPDDVPIPGSAHVAGSMTSREPGKEGAMLSLQSDDSPEALLDAFRSGLQGKGWTVERETAMMGQHILQASKGGRTLMLQVLSQGEGSHAMLHLVDAD